MAEMLNSPSMSHAKTDVSLRCSRVAVRYSCMRNCTSPICFMSSVSIQKLTRMFVRSSKNKGHGALQPDRCWGGLRFQLLVRKLVLHSHDLEALLQGRSRIHALGFREGCMRMNVHAWTVWKGTSSCPGTRGRRGPAQMGPLRR